MNFAAILGLIAGISITSFTILTSAKNPKVFGDIHGIVIVLGGTLTVALLCFPFSRLMNAMGIVVRKVFGRQQVNYLETIHTIVQIANTYRIDAKKSMDAVPKDAHPFLKDGMKYLIEYGFAPNEINEILSNALRGKKRRDDEEVKVWHTISRFPPAFGLLGATVGMIALLQGLGEPGAQDRIGPAMATALVATFYGLITANLVLIPLSEKLAEVAREDLIMRKIIKEGVLLIQEKRHPLYIEEHLKSFLAPKQRMIDMLNNKIGNSKAA